MRISDWSSDVCSSDLLAVVGVDRLLAGGVAVRRLTEVLGRRGVRLRAQDVVHPLVGAVGVVRLRRQHPGVVPGGRALVGQDRLDVLVLDDVVDDLPGGPDDGVADRKSVGSGKSVSVRVDLGGRGCIKKKITTRCNLAISKNKN